MTPDIQGTKITNKFTQQFVETCEFFNNKYVKNHYLSYNQNNYFLDVKQVAYNNTIYFPNHYRIILRSDKIIFEQLKPADLTIKLFEYNSKQHANISSFIIFCLKKVYRETQA